MQPSPDRVSEPIIEIFENLATPQLHAAAWATCMSDRWRFGHGSVEGGGARFWRMELSSDAAFLEIWENARARCEALAGVPLSVTQLYANGHTYGMGGNLHRDDGQAGAYTLLYYPNPEWQEEWDGQTLFYDEADEIALSVRIRPNRAVFFDSRIWHRGVAPGRVFTGLRVSVAYKLQSRSQSSARSVPVPRKGAPAGEPVPLLPVAAAPLQAARDAPDFTATVQEVEREGAGRVYSAQVAESVVQQAIDARLAHLSQSLRLPGFRAGHIPQPVLLERYGAEVRRAALKQLAAQVIEHQLPIGSLAGGCELISGEDSGAMEVRIFATRLADLPDPDFSAAPFERHTAVDPTPAETAFLRNSLKQQVLDRLDTAYTLPLFAGIVDREFSKLWKAAESQNAVPTDAAERTAFEGQLRTIAARRIRLGVVVTELARRYGIRADTSSELEDRTIDRLLATAPVIERALAADELQQLMHDIQP